MKINHPLMLCWFCFASIYTIDAQTRTPIAQPSKQPVLIDDHLSVSLKMAKDHFEHQRTANTSVWNSLSEKQKRSINEIELERDKKLSELDLKIAALKEEVKALELSSNTDFKPLEALKSKLSILAVERQRVITRSKDNIRSQLTKKQRRVYDKCQ